MDAPAPIEIRLLGGFRVAVHGRAVPADAWRQRRAAAVVKLLALAPSHRLHREQLIEMLWPELDGEAAANNLRVAIHRARRRLESAGADPDRLLIRDGEDVFLAVAPVWVDVDAFEREVARAWLTKSTGAAREALDLYTGDLLPEDLYEDWAADRRLELRASYLTLLAHLAQLHEQRDELGRAIAALQRLLSADPLDEAAHAALIRLFARAGEPRQAIAQYARLSELLDQELGTEPEPATRELVADIRAGRFPGETQPLAPATSPDQTAVRPDDRAVSERISNLPAPVDDPIGREREIAEVRRLLGARRLVTLTGPAGVGKTRLALAVAQLVAASQSAFVSFVELAPLQDPELVLAAIARGLGVRDAGGPLLLDTIAAHLGDTDCLVVLDNVEHLTAAAQDVADLLACCPRLRILATSRVRLRLRGEQEYPLDPLATPELSDRTNGVSRADPSAYPAVELFVQRARDARPDLQVSETELRAVAEICRRLDGLPLAIELAAARLRVLTPTALLARLDRPLAILTGGRADAPRRQQTLRAAIAWSHDLLSLAEQEVFARLAVFVGGFSLEAAEAVGGDGVMAVGGDGFASGGDGPSVLRGKRGEETTSPPSPPEAKPAPPSRSDSPSVLDLISSLVEQSLVRRLADEDGTPRFAMLETIREYAGERLTALEETRFIRQRHAAYFRQLAELAEPELTGTASAGWYATLEREHDNLRAALATLAEHDDRVNALRLAGALWRFWWRYGHLEEGRKRLAQALAAPGTAPAGVRANALDGHGTLAAAQGDHEAAAALHAEALRLWREVDDRHGEVRALTNLGLVADEQGEPQRAATFLQEALTVARASGHRRGSAVALANLGQVAIALADQDLAASLLAESVAIFRELGDRRDEAAILANLGVLAFLAGDFARARICHEEALGLFRDFGDRQAEADELLNLGHTVQHQGLHDRAAALFTEAHEAYRRLGDQSGMAYALTHRGRLAHQRGNDDDAEYLVVQGLAIAEQIADKAAIVEAWEALACVACARGEPARCARLIGAAETLRETIGVPLPTVHQPAIHDALSEARRALGARAFARARREGQTIALSAGKASLSLFAGNVAAS